MSLTYVRFADVNLSDPFFGSLKADYVEFQQWFEKKANNLAYLSTNASGEINGFLYLKIEDEDQNIIPPLAAKHRLKLGTLKIDAHGTKLGDRFVKNFSILQGVFDGRDVGFAIEVSDARLYTDRLISYILFQTAVHHNRSCIFVRSENDYGTHMGVWCTRAAQACGYAHQP